MGIGAMVTTGCKEKKAKTWGDKERKELRDELGHYRDMIYVDNLSEVEFDDFSGDVIEAVDRRWAEYGIGEFIDSPSRKYRKLLLSDKAEW